MGEFAMIVVVVLSMITMGVLGKAEHESRMERECNDYGKVKLWGKLYECNPL